METITLIVTFWLAFAGISAMVSAALGYLYDKLSGFRTHIHSCVVGGSCDAPHRSLHRALEMVAWRIMERDSTLRRVVAAYIGGFVLVVMAPVSITIWGMGFIVQVVTVSFIIISKRV